MATVNKNFRVKNGLIVEGATATVNGQNILTEASTAFIISTVGGASTSANTPNTVVKRDGSGNFSAGTITATDVTIDGISALTRISTAVSTAASDATTKANAAQAAAISAAATDATTKANAAQAAAATDATTKANAAQSAAATDATTKANAAQSAATSAAATDATTKADAAQAAAISAAATDATTKANAAKSFATAADTTLHTTITGEIATAKTEAISNAHSYTDTAVSNLVDAAPDLLNTLNELAAAIGDDPNFASSLSTAVGAKVSKSGDTMTGPLVLSGAPTTGLHAATKTYADAIGTAAATDATTKANAAQSAATSAAATDATSKANAAQSAAISAAATDATTKANAAQAAAEATASADATSKANAAQSAATSAAATDATTKANAAQAAATSAAATDATTKANAAQAAAEATASAALNAVKDGTTKFTAINVNDLTSTRAAQAVLASVSTGSSVMSWAKADYKTAKLWVKFETSTHSQVSELLLTTDASNNVAITEFATVGTNGDLGSTTAVYVSGNIGINVDTVNANTTVTVVATLIK